MGKFIGLVGAVTTVGAVAYLMAPLPQSATTALELSTSATKVAVAPKAIPATEPSNHTPVARAAPSGEPTVVLIQQIQAELHRLGCYGGAIDGKWNDATQRAMQTLGERVSVLRPVDMPDYIMLALARSQASAVCASPQRSAGAPSRTRLTAIATPEIAGPGKGELRPTNGTTRHAPSDPVRPSASEPLKVWRAVPDTPPKRLAVRDADPNLEAARLKAARDELTRIEMRKRAATVTSPAPQAPADTPADQVAASGTPEPDTTRMALGVRPGDPLQAHIDPRNPNAPAILRALPQPLPRFASRPGDSSAVNEPAGAAIPTNPPPGAAPPPSAVPLSATPPPSQARVSSKQAKREWQRNVFTNMRFNGP